MGNSAIMIEPSSLDDPTIEYSNVEPLEPSVSPLETRISLTIGGAHQACGCDTAKSPFKMRSTMHWEEESNKAAVKAEADKRA